MPDLPLRWTTTQIFLFDMDYLYLDIETIPGSAPGLRQAFIDAVEAPAQYKKPESIAEWLAANREREGHEQWLRTSFDGGYGHIACICWAFDDEPVNTLRSDSPLYEASMLHRFFHALDHGPAAPQIVGHNVISFDLRFLWQRAIVLGVRPSMRLPRDPKPWGDRVFDTMLAWSGQKDRISMDKLCKVLGIEGKGDMDGSKVWPMYEAGKFQEIADYCAADVERTRALHKRLAFL